MGSAPSPCGFPFSFSRRDLAVSSILLRRNSRLKSAVDGSEICPKFELIVLLSKFPNSLNDTIYIINTVGICQKKVIISVIDYCINILLSII